MPTSLYLDSCALSRLTDDQSQERIRLEAEAIERILTLVRSGEVHWFSSPFLQAELSRNPDPQKREEMLGLLAVASARATPTRSTTHRASELRAQGFGEFDALHLALAEECGADYLLTVDDRFLARAARQAQSGSLPVDNPLDWTRRRYPWLLTR